MKKLTEEELKELQNRAKLEKEEEEEKIKLEKKSKKDDDTKSKAKAAKEEAQRIALEAEKAERDKNMGVNEFFAAMGNDDDEETEFVIGNSDD